MKTLLIITGILLSFSCSTFNQYSKSTKIGKDATHVAVVNEDLNILSRTYGDFKFAMNKGEFKTLTQSKPAFKNILFYGNTINPAYEYYVLLNPKDNQLKLDGYDSKDTTINENRYVILISKNAPESDKQFILNNIRLKN